MNNKLIVLLTLIFITCSSKINSPIDDMVCVYVDYKVSSSYKQSDCYIYANGILNHVVINRGLSSNVDTIVTRDGCLLSARYTRSDVPSFIRTRDTIAKDSLQWTIK